MNPQDVNNFANWLQEILNTLRDTHTQLEDLRAENRQMMDDLRGISSRSEQKDSEILKSIDMLKGQLDILRGDVSAAKSTVDSSAGHLDSKMGDIKSAVNEVKRSV